VASIRDPSVSRVDTDPVSGNAFVIGTREVIAHLTDHILPCIRRGSAMPGRLERHYHVQNGRRLQRGMIGPPTSAAVMGLTCGGV
jgi:hypothetical protein